MHLAQGVSVFIMIKVVSLEQSVLCLSNVCLPSIKQGYYSRILISSLLGKLFVDPLKYLRDFNYCQHNLRVWPYDATTLVSLRLFSSSQFSYRSVNLL